MSERRTGGRAAAVCAALWLCLPATPARADIYGLVIGIDAYRHVQPLHGAVNDARDVADALRSLNAREVRLLLDDAATRAAILAAWSELRAKAAPGDTLVFSYAGHGGQEPERVRGSEATGRDSTFVLAGFATRGPGSAERIVDDEINQMLREASQQNVLFIADSCHSGTMTRAFDPRARRLTTRYASYPPIENDALPPPDPAAAALGPADLPHVVYFGAVADEEEAPETTIDGQQRGALSWAVARAFRSAAAQGGGLTKGELEVFVRENVRRVLEGRQHPRIEPAGQVTRAILPAPRLPLSIINAGSLDIADLYSQIQGVTVPAEGQAARLTWDIASGDIISDLGDVVARVRSGDPAIAARGVGRTGGQAQSPLSEGELGRVQSVVDKWEALRIIGRLSEERSLQLRLEPDDRLYREGNQVALTVGGHESPNFTLLNLASDGSVNFLYPLRGGQYNDPLQIPAGRPYRLELAVQPPFGADHFIAIASDQPLAGLHTALKALDGQPAAARVAQLLTEHLAGQRFQLGVHVFYTAGAER